MATERIETFEDLIDVLDRNPEYQRRLRQRFLDDEFMRLPAQTRALTERVNAHTEQIRALTEQVRANTEQIRANTERIQAITEQVNANTEQIRANTEQIRANTEQIQALTERVNAHTEQIRALTEQVRANTEQINANTEQINANTEQIRANTEQIRANTEQIQALTEQVKELVHHMKAVVARLDTHDTRLGRLERRADYLMGSDAEWRFRRNAGAYFGDILRRIRVIDNNDLAIQVDDAIVAGVFERADRRFVLALDLALRGRDWDTNEEKCLAVEVSVGLGQSDVERAKSRAILLEKLLGVPAIPVVAGYSIAPEFQRLADGQGVQVVITEEPV